MRFNQATKSPVILEVGDQKLSVPKFTLRDQVAWAAELDATRAEAATRGMDAQKKFHVLNTWDIIPTDLTDLFRRVKTPTGIARICGTCLARAKFLDANGNPAGDAIGLTKAEEIMEANADGLAWLAEQLADIRDQSKPPAAPDSNDSQKEGTENPLTNSATTV